METEIPILLTHFSKVNLDVKRHKKNTKKQKKTFKRNNNCTVECFL